MYFSYIHADDGFGVTDDADSYVRTDDESYIMKTDDEVDAELYDQDPKVRVGADFQSSISCESYAIKSFIYRGTSTVRTAFCDCLLPGADAPSVHNR